MNKFTTFGIQYDIDLDKNQQIIIEEVTYFPQYNGCIVKDIYDFIDMDPWNEEIPDVFENEIGGDELDLLYKDLEELSYKSKQSFLKETISSKPNISKVNKRKFTELLNNAQEMMCDNLVVLVYRVKGV